jgi:AcrR family transcriptional regulator
VGRKPTDKQRHRNPRKTRPWITTLAAIYFTKGVRNLSMDDIAGILGVSKATLYKYFATREEILEEVVQHKLRSVSRFQAALFDTRVPYVERYFLALELSTRELANVSTEFLEDLRELYPDVFQRVMDFVDAAVMVLGQFYAQGVEAGVFRRLHPQVMAYTDRIFLQSLTDIHNLRRMGVTFETALREYFRMKFLGIFPASELTPELEKRLEGLVHHSAELYLSEHPELNKDPDEASNPD